MTVSSPIQSVGQESERVELISQMGILPMTIVHIAGVVLGLGIATGLDLWLMQSIFRQSIVSSRQFDNIILLGKLTSLALLLLWISGIGFLVYYYAVVPEKLLNPKIWSKLTIVGILTVNGLVIHHWVLPRLQECIGAPLISGLRYKTLAIFFVSGAVSFVSWYFPFFYGMFPSLNFAYSLQEFMLAYLLVIMLAILAGLTLLGFLHAKYTHCFSVRQNRIIKTMLSREEQSFQIDAL